MSASIDGRLQTSVKAFQEIENYAEANHISSSNTTNHGLIDVSVLKNLGFSDAAIDVLDKKNGNGVADGQVNIDDIRAEASNYYQRMMMAVQKARDGDGTVTKDYLQTIGIDATDAEKLDKNDGQDDDKISMGILELQRDDLARMFGISQGQATPAAAAVPGTM